MEPSSKIPRLGMVIGIALLFIGVLGTLWYFPLPDKSDLNLYITPSADRSKTWSARKLMVEEEVPNQGWKSRTYIPLNSPYEVEIKLDKAVMFKVSPAAFQEGLKGPTSRSTLDSNNENKNDENTFKQGTGRLKVMGKCLSSTTTSAFEDSIEPKSTEWSSTLTCESQKWRLYLVEDKTPL
jgi:hypothetical protein